MQGLHTCSPAAHAQTAPTPELPTVQVTDTADSSGYTAPLSAGGKEALPVRQILQSVSLITEQRIRDQKPHQRPRGAEPGHGRHHHRQRFHAEPDALARLFAGGHLGRIPAYNSLSGYQQMDLALYERVEVLRGPSGLFTGVGDPGGVVNLVRKRARSTFGLSATESAGNVTGPLNEDSTVRARGVLSVQDRDYFYDRTGNRCWLGYGTVEWDITRATMLSLSAAVQDDKTAASSFGLPTYATGGLLGALRSTSTAADWSRDTWRTQEYTAELEQRFDSGWLAKARFSHRPQDFYFKDGYPTTGLDLATNTLTYARRVRDYAYERNAVNLYATGPFELFGRSHKLLVGYNRERFSSIYPGANASAVTGIPFGQTHLAPDFDLPYNLGGRLAHCPERLLWPGAAQHHRSADGGVGWACERFRKEVAQCGTGHPDGLDARCQGPAWVHPGRRGALRHHRELDGRSARLLRRRRPPHLHRPVRRRWPRHPPQKRPDQPDRPGRQRTRRPDRVFETLTDHAFLSDPRFSDPFVQGAP